MKGRRGEKGLLDASYVVLGMAATLDGEVTGYRIDTLAPTTVGLFYPVPTRSQIYGEFNRLEAVGFVTSRDDIKGQRMRTRFYKVTPDGVDGLCEWLRTTEFDPADPHLRVQAALRFTFARFLEQSEVYELIDSVEAAYEQRHELLRDLEATRRDEEWFDMFSSEMFGWGDLETVNIRKWLNDMRSVVKKAPKSSFGWRPNF